MMRLPLVTVLVLAPFAAHAATYEFDTIENGKTTDKSTVVLAPNALCMENADTDGSGSPNNMVFVQDPPTIYYSRDGKVEKLDQARIDELKGQMNQALGGQSDLHQKMEEALAKVPPAQREMMRKQMEKYMGAAGVPKVATHLARTYKSTGRTMTKYGYKATEYTVMNGENKVGTAYLAPIAAIPQGPELMARVQKLMDFAKSMMAQFGGQNVMTGNFMNLPDGYFPVGGMDFDDNGKPTSETRLVAASKDTPDTCKAPE